MPLFGIKIVLFEKVVTRCRYEYIAQVRLGFLALPVEIGQPVLGELHKRIGS